MSERRMLAFYAVGVPLFGFFFFWTDNLFGRITYGVFFVACIGTIALLVLRPEWLDNGKRR